MPTRVRTEFWRIERAERMAVIVDAADYFRTARVAMLGARRRILLIGKAFDARISLEPGVDRPGEPSTLGAFMHLVERDPELEIFMLRWGAGAFNSLFRGSTLFTMIKWMRHKRIHTKLDGHHPTAASHHQKIVIIDDALALMEALDRRDTQWRMRMYHPYTDKGAPIYCHAKILIAEDDVFRLGSSNVNNRSFAA